MRPNLEVYSETRKTPPDLERSRDNREVHHEEVRRSREIVRVRLSPFRIYNLKSRQPIPK